MREERTWPKPGEQLIHRFRRKEGEVVAEVVAADRDTGKIVERVGETTYPSLSAAAHAITGHATNGWTFWGLKEQAYRKRRER